MIFPTKNKNTSFHKTKRNMKRDEKIVNIIVEEEGTMDEESEGIYAYLNEIKMNERGKKMDL